MTRRTIKRIRRTRTLRKSKRKTRTIRKTRNRRKTRTLRGGYDKIQIQNFRIMFMKSLSDLQGAISKTAPLQINKAKDKFKNNLRDNQNNINTLIPVNKDGDPVDKYSPTSGLTSLVPPLVVIFNKIRDMNIRSTLLNAFIANGANINLTNYVKDITVLSEAIRLRDKPLIEMLLQKGADITTLSEEQRNEMNELMKEPATVVVEPVIEEPIKREETIKPEETVIEEPLVPVIPPKPFIKLTIPMDLPSEQGYNPDIEPDFWTPIFEEDEMFAIRKLINDIMIADGSIPITNGEVASLWSICEIVHSIIPTFFTPTKNDPYMLFDTMFKDTDVDFKNFNIVLCSTLIIFGIISYKMIGQEYKFIFKGGKAIQLVLAEIQNLSEYKSEDIDVLIMPDKNIQYDELIIKNLAGHLAYLIRWFLNIPSTDYKISVQSPNPENTRANPYIFKLSYIKSLKKQDFRKQILVDDFKQFSDIDFKELPIHITPYFQDDSKEYNFEISLSDIKQKLMFRCPNLGALLNEKIYYYAKYSEFKQLLQQNQPIQDTEYKTLTIPECDRFLEKFKRAILAMNIGLQKQRKQNYDTASLLEREKTSIKNRLDKLAFTNPSLQTAIIQSLYP